jgi:transaldolase
MKIFIDSAKLEEIKEIYDTGILDGVTTNPSLIKSAVAEIKRRGEKLDIKGYIKKILVSVPKAKVNLEVTANTYEEMVEEGKNLFKTFNPIAKNVYIKIPINPSFDKNERYLDGLKAIKKLSYEKIPINCTLIFTPEQALLAAKAGAKIVSLFVGRVDDYLRVLNKVPFSKSDYFPAKGKEGWHDNGIVSGIDLVRQVVEIFRKYNIKSQVLAASIRNARQAREAALVGTDIATLPFEVIKEMLFHYKTKEGMIDFTKDSPPEYLNLTRKVESKRK